MPSLARSGQMRKQLRQNQARVPGKQLLALRYHNHRIPTRRYRRTPLLLVYQETILTSDESIGRSTLIPSMLSMSSRFSLAALAFSRALERSPDWSEAEAIQDTTPLSTLLSGASCRA